MLRFFAVLVGVVAFFLCSPAHARVLALPTTWSFSDGKQTLDVTVPGEVCAQGFKGFEGFGFYHAELDAAQVSELLIDYRAGDGIGLALGPADDAYQVSVNGIVIGSAGTLSDDPNKGQMAAQHSYTFKIDDLMLQKIRSINSARWDIDVKLWVDPTHARAFNGSGGFYRGTYLIGPHDVVTAKMDAERWRFTFSQVGQRLLVWIVLIIAGFYSILLYVRRRELTEYMWFGLFGLLLGTAQIFWFLRDFGFIDDYWTIFRIFGRQFFFYAVGAFLYFCIHFSRMQPKLIDKVVAGSLALLGLGQALTAQLHPYSLQLGRPILLVGVGLSAYRIVQAVIRRVPDAKTLLLGIGFICLSAIYLIIEGQRWISLPMPSADFASYMIFIMLLSIGAALLNRFARAYSELDVKNTELLRADKIKDEFLANTSHELRTPLNGIIGIAESLVTATEMNKADKPYLEKNLALIVASGRRLASLVNDILDFSKLRHNTIELRKTPVDIRAAVDVVVSLLNALDTNSTTSRQKKDVVIVNEIPTDAPLLDADENRLQQILTNIIGNAIKFTPSGSITIRTQYDDKTCTVSVTDTGIGINQDVIARIFNSFEQGDGSTEREYGGTGLGLAVSKQLVELHGGTIRAESAGLGQGTTLFFTLPVSTIQDKKSANVPQRQTANAATKNNLSADGSTLSTVSTADIHDEPIQPHNQQKFCVLAVDDEPINLQVIENHLHLYHYDVHLADDGFAALALIEKGLRPDIIISDVMMPRMSGYELTRKIRERFPDVPLPIMLLTAKNRESDLVEGFTAGASDYLTKPFSKQELVARLQAHLKICKMDAAARRFVPFEVLKILGKESLIDVERGESVQQKAMSILFSDIRSFTTISEKHKPEEIFQFINAYLSSMEPNIHNNNGFVNQYLGDGIMALFHQKADDAVQAAVGMQRTLRVWNEERIKQGAFAVEVGIGINTGSIILGTVGGGERLDCNVIGDAVNLASRIEGMTKFYQAKVLITGGTVEHLQNKNTFTLRPIDRVVAKGKVIPIDIYEVLDAESDAGFHTKQKMLDDFAEAVFLYRQAQFADAIELFRKCNEAVMQATTRADGASLLYIARCEKYLALDAIPADFDGVMRWEEK